MALYQKQEITAKNNTALSTTEVSPNATLRQEKTYERD